MNATPLHVSPPLLPNLPEELVISIMLRLPVKSLLKFKCVSKSWLKLISSYRFVKDHFKQISTRTNSNDRLMFGSNRVPKYLYSHSIESEVQNFDSNMPIYTSPNEDELVFNSDGSIIRPPPGAYIRPGHRVWVDPPLYGTLSLVGSCNGLICVSLSFFNLILFNPTTRKLKKLPNSGSNFDDIFCPIEFGFGFGYDDMHDDYKVVELLCFQDAYPGEIEIQSKVYSLRANSWKTLSKWPGGNFFDGSGKFFNGAIHWSACDFDGWAIVSLDLTRDIFKVLKLPSFDARIAGRVKVQVLEGCLAVCCNHDPHTDVWLMKEYGVRESWTKVVHIINPHQLPVVPLFLFPDGRILMNYGSTLSVYDPRNPPCMDLFSPFRWVEALTYFESLVSPNLDDKMDDN